MQRINIPFMLLAVFALLAGLWAGLLRLSWTLPLLHPTLPMAHGPLMVSGFRKCLSAWSAPVGWARLGPGRRWAYGVPALAGLGGLLLAFGVPGSIGPLLLTLGSAVFVAAMVTIARFQPLLYTRILAAAASAGWWAIFCG